MVRGKVGVYPAAFVGFRAVFAEAICLACSRYGPAALGSNCCKYCNSSRRVDFRALENVLTVLEMTDHRYIPLKHSAI
ncbi:MAG: hypothetical protein EXQ52_03985 [Bryobacterales bacterium]|nr:hypothetical protein [Bryobacterales bacterium]